ncbi:MAG TPA: T9SS type A sorting domain-containing protein, partial [Chitinivibrionales bacterium]|nr:T9SS type A sorting domain-containing protein [Chitinivibrionales bacterium]
GTSWAAVNSGLTNTNIAVQSLAVSGSNIFAATFYSGVFLSTNNGTSWNAVNTGLPANTGVYSLAVSGSNIFAGTWGGGVWYRPLSEMTEVINPNPQQKISKPFTGEFKINHNKTNLSALLPTALTNSTITVGLFNVAGKEIYSVKHQTHNGILNIPISGLPAGRYLISITGRNTTLSSSIVLTR